MAHLFSRYYYYLLVLYTLRAIIDEVESKHVDILK